MLISMPFVAILVRFWGWSENKREEERDFAELSQLAREGKPLYGESHQPLWVQNAAYSNSAFSQLKFSACLHVIIYTRLTLPISLYEGIFPM
jgi:hypothetical protein